MIRIEMQGVTVDVAPETVRSQMDRQITYRKINACYKDIAETMGYDADEILSQLASFAGLGPRVTVLKGELDFEFIIHRDNAQQMTDKCTAYFDSQYLKLIEEIITAINNLDYPHDPDLTAGALPETVEKKD